MLGNEDGDLSSGGKIRTVFDVGCGVASFGAFLLPLDIIAMSLAPNDVHANQIQFALERGIPAMLGVLGTMRLPYPSKSFDMAHCSRCRIDWHKRDGILLLEVDRLLRPGGYFAWSSPAVYRETDADRQEWDEMSVLVRNMCWEQVAKELQTVIWRKPLTSECYDERAPETHPPVCSSLEDPDDSWSVRMKTCITPLTKCKSLLVSFRHEKLRGEVDCHRLCRLWSSILWHPYNFARSMRAKSFLSQMMKIF
jgi:SAM-dependent methyltransferase